MNAKFWIYYKGSPVKVALRPGQAVQTIEGGRTDEGFSYLACHYHHTGGRVVQSWNNWGRDCDGRSSQIGTSYCFLDSLNLRFNPSIPDVMFPRWEYEHTEQRDEYAEAMNY